MRSEDGVNAGILSLIKESPCVGLPPADYPVWGSTVKFAEKEQPTMSDETAPDRPDPIEEDPTDTLDLAHPDSVQIGVTRGESDIEIGPPRDYPDRADVSVRPEDERVVLSIDAMAGDHGTGHVDATLTPAEARKLSERLAETARWMTEDESDGGTE